MPSFIDLTGKKYHRLTVLSRADSLSKKIRWNCICECGNKSIVFGQYLKSGKTKSCGCYHREKASERRFIHGKSIAKKPIYTREIHIKKKYGLSLETYNEMFEHQNGRCVICDYKFGQKKGDCYVDHCHETMAVRGLLCQNCNTGLGNFKDKAERISRAASYLSKFKNALAR
jgi:hypothetical protein